MQACDPDLREDVELMEQLMPDPSIQTQPEADLAQLIVTTLNLEVAAAEIDPRAPLFGEGLGLDSIDVLELALAISQTYGVQLRSDDENNATIFQSLRSLTEDIQQRRSR
jgi:acyl carrier protein